MIPEDYTILINKLEEVSKVKSNVWEKTSDGNKFALKSNGNTVIVHDYEYFDYDNHISKPTVSLEIMNKQGEVIDGIYIDESESGYSTLLNLYKSARRNALSIKETISSIVNGLDELIPTF